MGFCAVRGGGGAAGMALLKTTGAEHHPVGKKMRARENTGGIQLSK